MCSFIFTNKKIEDLEYVNYFNKFRGPDCTNEFEKDGYTFIHNLLSITGEYTVQPFIEDDIVCVYNGGGYGLKWFSNHFSNIPPSRLPDFSSVENVKSALRTVVLQKIALDKTDEVLLNYGAVIQPKLLEMKIHYGPQLNL